MYKNQRVVVVLPAYNAEKTLEKTVQEIDKELVDEIVIVDDFSSDETVAEAKKIGIEHIISHERNKGYGGNQKSCYNKALEIGADIVVMVHPDYQTPRFYYLPWSVSLVMAFIRSFSDHEYWGEGHSKEVCPGINILPTGY